MNPTVHTSLLVFAILLLGPVVSRAAEDILIEDFEGTDFVRWRAEGPAFKQGPARNKQLPQLEIENFRGNGVASSEMDGDAPTGTLTSSEFQIQRPYITLLIGGGAYEHHTCANLLVNGKVVRSATGWNSDRLFPVTWDVREFQDRNARLRLVDDASGTWGHINVDQVIQTDHPERLPANTQPLYNETHRPQFHFTARQWSMNRLNPGMRQEGWVNDLNGLIFYEGEYHLFAQRWNKCWVHAISRDLVHWTELEPAFWEEKLDSGVQSGTCVVDYENTSGLSASKATPAMVAFWSRNDNRSQCISFSLDRGRTWSHYKNNPVLVHPERDPKVFWHAPSHRWVMMLYGDQKYHIFTSTNLLNWRDERHPILNSFECPDFFELAVDGNPAQKKWVLIRGNGKYSLGNFNGTEFNEETGQFESDAGPNFYATQSWANNETGDGRRIQAAWMNGGVYPDMPFNQQISFPRELTLRITPNGPRLYRRPAREITALHRNESSWTNRTLHAGQRLPLAPSGELFHIQAELEIPETATLTFNVRGTPVVLKHHSVTCGGNPVLTTTKLESIEILIDRTSIESFANDGEVSASKCYLPRESDLSIRASGGAVMVKLLRVFELDSAWR